jgi:parallel beta-helix repeat protein
VKEGLYHENVIVNKIINLTGENKNTTIIDGRDMGHVIIVNSNWVNITGFSVINGGTVSSPDLYAGIELENIQNCTIFGNNVYSGCFGIHLNSSSYNNIISNNIFDNLRGIFLEDSSFNNINSNIVFNNIDSGITLLVSCDYNNLSKNKLESNGIHGISVGGSSFNLIFHNNIINNTYHAYDSSGNNYWDNGYPFGGNYWSDYDGDDKYKGPNQDILGSDGIGDTPYFIDLYGRDNYPLMILWEDFLYLDIIPPSTIHDYDGLWHTSNFTITLTSTDDKSGVNNTYYRINNEPIKTVSIDGQPFITSESDNNALEYWSVDKARNEEEHKFLYNIKLDKTPPSSYNDYDGLEHYFNFVITLTASDGLSGIEDIFYKINDGAVLTVSINGQPIITVEDENNTLEYWAVDVAGNIEEYHFLYGIKLNKTYPDLTVTTEDIVFSKSRLIEGIEVYINTTIHNIGNLSAQATVKVYDGEPATGSLIGEIIIQVGNQNHAIASIKWTPSRGFHNIHVLISDSIPYDPFTNNNRANKSIIVEIPPILVLSVGDLNIFRFESGEERTVPVYVSCYNNSATNIRLIILDNRGLNITVVTPPQNLSKDGMAIFYLRIKAPDLEEGEEFKEEDILLQVISDEIRGNSESLDIIVGKSAADFLGLILLLGGAAAGAGTVAFIGGTEIGKYALFAASMSLYTRLKREDVLDQETRGMIRGYIIANPGEHYNAIKRALGLKNGTLAYHLKTLEKEKLIKSVRDGRYKRFYPPNMKVSEEVIILNKAQELIMGQIIDNPGISQKELANKVGLSTSTINYHISVMANAGFIRVERKGKHTMCYPEDEAS